MIYIKNLTEDDIGKWVTYTWDIKNHIIGLLNGNKPVVEVGKIKWWNDECIFVVFKCNNEWDNFKNYTGQACDSRNLFYSSSQLG